MKNTFEQDAWIARMHQQTIAATTALPQIIAELRRTGKLHPMSQAIKPPPRMDDPDYDDLLYIPGFEENPYT